MTPEDLDWLYPDGPMMLPPELQAERPDRAT